MSGAYNNGYYYSNGAAGAPGEFSATGREYKPNSAFASVGYQDQPNSTEYAGMYAAAPQGTLSQFSGP